MASRLIHLTTPDGFALIGTVGDPEGTRTITSIVVLLVALGIGLVMVAIWLWRSTRPDPELLAPLEAMDERRWRRADPVWQRRRLDELRPDAAEPLVHSSAPPDIDESFDAGPAGTGFDDLDDVSLREPESDGPEIVGAPRRVVDVDEDELDPPSGGRVGAWTPRHLDRPESNGPDAADEVDERSEDPAPGSNGDAAAAAEGTDPDGPDAGADEVDARSEDPAPGSNGDAAVAAEGTDADGPDAAADDVSELDRPTDVETADGEEQHAT